MSDTYTDWRFNFPITGLATALEGFVALQQAGILGEGDIPSNMLGTPRDAMGSQAVDVTKAAWRGDPGRAAYTYTDPATNMEVNVPAVGDPTRYYVAMRATVTAAQIAAAGIDPATYGLTVTDAATSAAVLGVWA